MLSLLSSMRFSQCLGLVVTITAFQLPSYAQTNINSSVVAQNETVTEEVIIEENTVTPINQTESLLSLEGGQRLMQEAEEAISQENYDLAATKLQQARRIFNQLSNFYLQLAESFAGINNRITEEQRAGALKTASFRDESTYQLALVHRAQNKPELAVPLLIQIIRSQNPSSELGKKSYQQLYEIGFVQIPLESPNQ